MSTIFVADGLLTKHAVEALGAEHFPIVVNTSQDIFLAERLGLAVPIRDPWDYLTEEDFSSIYDRAFELAQGWYRLLDPADYHYLDLSLADIAEYDFVTLFLEALKGIRLSQRILEREKPSRVVVTPSGGIVAKALRAVGERVGVEVECLPELGGTQKPLLPQASLLEIRRFIGSRPFSILSRMRAAVDSLRASSAHTILMPAYFRLQPLAVELGRDQRFRVLILGGTPSQIIATSLRGGSVRYLSGSGYLTWRHRLSVRRYLDRIEGRWDEIVYRLVDDSFAYDGVGLMDLLKDEIREAFCSTFPNYACFYEMANALIDREGVDCVAVNQDLARWQKVLIWVGNARGLRTICFQHGASPDLPRYGRHIAKQVALWGEHEREVYLKNGHATPERIAVVGDPFLQVLKTTRYSRQEICHRLGLDPEKKIILMAGERFVTLCSQFERPGSSNRTLWLVCNTVREMKDVQLLVRLKEEQVYAEFGGDFELKREILRQARGIRVVVDSTSDVYQLLFIADLVVVTFSTLGLEAMLFGKPVLVLHLDRDHDLMGYLKSGGVLCARDEGEISPAITAALYDEATRRRLAEAQDRFLKYNFTNLEAPDPLVRIRSLFAPPSEDPMDVGTSSDGDG